MDLLPNEIAVFLLEAIFRLLDKTDFPRIRLLNSRFNELAISFIQKNFKISFTQISQLEKFIENFEIRSSRALPFQNFLFGERLLLWYPDARPAVKQFCTSFGNFVKTWDLFVKPEETVFITNMLSENVITIMENCENVEEFTLYISKTELGEKAKLPILNKLHSLNIMYELDSNFTVNTFPLLDQIVQKAPNLSNISVCRASMLDLTQLFNRLHITKPNVNISSGSKVCLPEKLDHIKNLIQISSQMKITKLSLYFYECCLPAKLNRTELQRLLSEWIGTLKYLRRFTFCDFDGTFYKSVGAISLPFLPALEHLDVTGVLTSGLTITKHVKFPVLKTLSWNISNEQTAQSFSGCILENVKTANIEISRDAQAREWSLALPNVEKLRVRCRTLSGITRYPFRSLRKLRICVSSWSMRPSPSEHRSHWDQITGGAKYIPEEKIFEFEVCDAKVAQGDCKSTSFFGNLPHLKRFTFRCENIECLKGVIYASRTGKLRRLEKLKFILDFKIDDLARYQEALTQFHDSVILLVTKK